LRSNGLTVAVAPVVILVSRLSMQCARRLGSKRTRLRASVFATHSSPVVGCTAMPVLVVPTAWK